MTNLEVEIISRETIKPSSPTPPHLRTFKLNHLDQRCPLSYPPLVLFYTKTKDPTAHLKNSLSQALTRFYPLAGRIKDNLYLDCNDEGALFLIAKVTSSSSLTEFLQNPPRIDLLERFLPLPIICRVPAEAAVQVAVQINLFSCGGIAVGVSGLHKIMDAATISSFLKCWAAIARGSSVAERVDCVGAASVFPPRESETALPPASVGRSLVGQEGIRCNSTRRFVFDAEAISKLKTKTVTNPTSNEALSGFLWKCLMKASKKASGMEKPSVLSIAVNLRPRVEPPVPEHKVGNIIWKGCCVIEKDDDEQDLVALIRDSIAGINREFVKKMVGKDGIGVVSKLWEEMGKLCRDGNPNCYVFTSLRHMGISELDFGWGKAMWVGFKEIKECRNVVTLIETRGGDGIEAWVTLAEDELFILETDPQFLAFASLNPAILLPST